MLQKVVHILTNYPFRVNYVTTADVWDRENRYEFELHFYSQRKCVST